MNSVIDNVDKIDNKMENLENMLTTILNNQNRI